MPRNRSRAALAIVAALALGGCASGLPTGPVVMVPATRAMAQGQAEFVLRTFARSPDGSAVEIGGADCEMRSILFEARLKTPARVIVPSFGPQSVMLEFQCAAGELSGAAQQRATTRWIRQPSGFGWWGPPRFGYYGPAGALWDNPSYAVFDYPDVSVSLR